MIKPVGIIWPGSVVTTDTGFNCPGVGPQVIWHTFFLVKKHGQDTGLPFEDHVYFVTALSQLRVL